MMKALIVEKDENGKTRANVQKINENKLPPGDVTVAISHSTLNYKDGLCIGSGGGLVRSYPHIPGIDFSGHVEHSENVRFKEGDKVILTGWHVGETHWGGYAEKARVKGEWLVPMPKAMTPRQAMAIGTAGFTAMLAVMALENHGLKIENGAVLVTGAAGGVGSVALAILSKLGYETVAVTGRAEMSNYLKSLGANHIIAREEINEAIKRPLESEKWAGCIDAVGGAMLARILGQMKHSASVSTVGLAGGANVPASVIPFLLRGINLLGIDSVLQPYENRVRAWERLTQDLPMEKLESMISPATLEELPQLGNDILKGKIKGRIVVEINP